VLVLGVEDNQRMLALEQLFPCTPLIHPPREGDEADLLANETKGNRVGRGDDKLGVCTKKNVHSAMERTMTKDAIEQFRTLIRHRAIPDSISRRRVAMRSPRLSPSLPVKSPEAARERMGNLRSGR